MAECKQQITGDIRLDDLARRTFRCKHCGQEFQIKDYKEPYEDLKEVYAKDGRKPCVYCFGELCPLCWFKARRCRSCIEQGLLSDDCMRILEEEKGN